MVFDARVERFTAGRVPSQSAQRLDVDLVGDYAKVTGVAHNAGDDLRAATQAMAYGVDAIEIAWDVAQLRDTVLLHLKDGSLRYLTSVRDFVAARPIRRMIVQTDDRETLREMPRIIPSAERLLLVLDSQDLERLHGDDDLLGIIDGVSVRETLLSAPEQTWLEQRGLLTFAWTVNDERRMNELVARGIDGLITERLDMMQLLGDGPDPTL